MVAKTARFPATNSPTSATSFPGYGHPIIEGWLPNTKTSSLKTFGDWSREQFLNTLFCSIYNRVWVAYVQNNMWHLRKRKYLFSIKEDQWSDENHLHIAVHCNIQSIAVALSNTSFLRSINFGNVFDTWQVHFHGFNVLVCRTSNVGSCFPIKLSTRLWFRHKQ